MKEELCIRICLHRDFSHSRKKSVARTIPQGLMCEDKKDGYLEGPDDVVSWCFGHLAEYAMPEAYDERCRKWSLEALPIISDNWMLEVTGDKASRFKILKDLLNSNEFLLRGKCLRCVAKD